MIEMAVEDRSLHFHLEWFISTNQAPADPTIRQLVSALGEMRRNNHEQQGPTYSPRSMPLWSLRI
jgi:hypothetical protein